MGMSRAFSRADDGRQSSPWRAFCCSPLGLVCKVGMGGQRSDWLYRRWIWSSLGGYSHSSGSLEKHPPCGVNSKSCCSLVQLSPSLILKQLRAGTLPLPGSAGECNNTPGHNYLDLWRNWTESNLFQKWAIFCVWLLASIKQTSQCSTPVITSLGLLLKHG